ncbi:MAG TPA: hypothetical protein VFB88_10610, partial [Xanthobacteraceae bacterium]|nr:hypothetical protein [Xanthobacteraceae bacterium]
DGKLQIRRDVYGLDSRTLAAIKSERAVVDPPQERQKEIATSSQRRPAMPRTVSFFESLFGGGPGPAVQNSRPPVPVQYGYQGFYQNNRPVPPRNVR